MPPAPPRRVIRFLLTSGLLGVASAAFCVPQVAAPQKSPSPVQPPTVPRHAPPDLDHIAASFAGAESLAYRVWNGMPVVEAFPLPGRPAAFALDTGLDACAFAPLAVNIFGLPKPAGSAVLHVMDRAYTEPVTTLPELRFSSFSVSKIPVAAVDVLSLLSGVASFRPGAPVGWLGGDFLSHFQPTFQFDRNILVLEKPNGRLPSGRGVVVVPAQITGNLVRIPVAIGAQKPFPALIDTAAATSVLPTSVARRAGLKPLDLIPFVDGAGGAGTLARVAIPKLSVGRAQEENVAAVYVAPQSPPKVRRDLALLGMDFLRRFRLTIDYARRQVALEPIPKSETKAGAGP